MDQRPRIEEPWWGEDDLRHEELYGNRMGSPFLPSNDLQQCIADICTWQKKPVLNIVDAYRIMHQNGPQGKSAADVATLKSLIASTNIVAIDTAALRLFNQVKKLDMAAVGHIGKGEALKLGTTNLDNVTIKRIKI